MTTYTQTDARMERRCAHCLSVLKRGEYKRTDTNLYGTQYWHRSLRRCYAARAIWATEGTP